jgi:LPXTG-site transpeptidase (sortase) family protein
VTARSVSGNGGGNGGENNPTPAALVADAFLIPVTGFAPSVVTSLDVSSRPAYDGTELMLEIPVIKVKAPIVGVELKDGNWDVSWLQNQVGWLNGTAYPTWKGNSILTAHVVNADGKPGVFSRLRALGVGEYIFVMSSGYRYTYKVVSNAYVSPNDTSVLKHEEKAFLTLITCDTYDEMTRTYLRRVAVRATLVDVRPLIR